MPTPPYPLSHGNIVVNGVTFKNPIPGSKDPVPPTAALKAMLDYIRANGKSQVDSTWNTIPASGTLTEKQNLVGVYFANLQGNAGTGNGGNGLPPLPLDPIKHIGSGIADSINSVTDFLKLLTDPALWLRIAEFAVGVILLGIGIAKVSTSGANIVRHTPIGKLI